MGDKRKENILNHNELRHLLEWPKVRLHYMLNEKRREIFKSRNKCHSLITININHMQLVLFPMAKFQIANLNSIININTENLINLFRRTILSNRCILQMVIKILTCNNSKQCNNNKFILVKFLIHQWHPIISLVLFRKFQIKW